MKDGTLCVIYVVPSKADATNEVQDHLTNVKEDFVSKVTSGINFTFAKLDAGAEPAFAEILGLESLPALVVMNAGKRKRFLVHEGEMTSQSLQKTL